MANQKKPSTINTSAPSNSGNQSNNNKPKKQFRDRLSNKGKDLYDAAVWAKQHPAETVDIVRDSTGKVIRAIGKGVQNAGKVVKGVVQTAADLKTLINHPEWYTKYSLDTRVTPNFGRILGSRASDYSNMTTTDGKQGATWIDNYQICAIPVHLTKPTDKYASFESAVRTTFSKIRLANTGSVNYTVQELERYILNCRSAVALYAYARRLCSIPNIVNPYFMNTPQLIAAAAFGDWTSSTAPNAGTVYQDIVANLAALKSATMALGKAIRSNFPFECSLLDRTEWMFSNIFKDSDDAKAQLYVFTPVDKVAVDERPLTGNILPIYGESAISYKGWTSCATLIVVLQQWVSSVSAALPNTAIIAGDILRAFGSAAMRAESDWPLHMAAPIIYDEAALTQIQNMTVGGAVYTEAFSSADADGSINTTLAAEDLSSIVFAVTDPTAEWVGLQVYPTCAMDHAWLNSYKDVVDNGDVLSWSRLVSLALADCDVLIGTEAVIGALHAYTYNTAGLVSSVEISCILGSFQSKASVSAPGEFGTAIYGNEFGAWAAFDYMPRYVTLEGVIIPTTGGAGTNKAAIDCGANWRASARYIWDWNNMARVESDVLHDYSSFAIRSLLKVGDVSEVSKWAAVASQL